MLRRSNLAAVTDAETLLYQWIDPLTAADLDRIVDERWDPAVSLGSRLVSILNDDMQHLGQAAYLRGLLIGDRKPAGVQQVS
ncbi:hypothetical protein [Nocardia sp. NBC_01499]|uniref:hypothetical protein n=1 Tax=Nocardia sp. NBC_01499 TaxID=2903597 RepID=UPI003867E15A